MQDFIQMAAQQLGASNSTIESATGGVLGLIQTNAGAGDFKELLSKVPGASDMLAKAPSSGGAPGGGIGGALGGLTSALGGGGLGSAAGLIGMLTGSGLDAGKAGSFLGLLLNYLKGKAGQDLVGKILGQVPELAKLAS